MVERSSCSCEPRRLVVRVADTPKAGSSAFIKAEQEAEHALAPFGRVRVPLGQYGVFSFAEQERSSVPDRAHAQRS